MAEKVNVELTTGKSKSEVAFDMARLILLSMEKRELKDIKRTEYLKTIVQCVDALGGIAPSS